MLSVSRSSVCASKSHMEQKFKNAVQMPDFSDGSVKLSDENGNNDISAFGPFPVDINSNSPTKLRSTYSRKREASTSLSEDPKRRDPLTSSHRIKSKCCSAQELPCCHFQDCDFLASQFALDKNLNNCYIDCSDINFNKCTASKCYCTLTFSSICQEDQTSGKAVNIDIKDNCQTGSDLSSKGSSTSSSISDLSVHSVSNSVGIQEDLNCLHLNDETIATQPDIAPKKPLVPSLFHRVPPTIYFSNSEEKVFPLPVEVCKLLKWKLSTITPVCIRQIVERAGFQLIKGDSSDWVGTWGKHMKCLAFKNIQEFQKVNHFPGSFHLGRKDKIWLIYSKMLARHGNESFSFFPETYILPQDIRQLRQVWEKEGPQKRWIIKPPASARGTGIKVINRWSQIPKKRPVIVQRYLSEPYLINGAKFDLRLYVLVPSYEPLRMYIFDDGLVRFASERYSSSVLSLNDPFMHLTNYCINRKNSSYTANDDENCYQAHKWSLKLLWNYMMEKQIDTGKIWEEILDLVIKTIICSEGPMTRLIKNHTRSRYCCFELFGFDIMLDKMLKPWLLEVNISPSLHTSSALDTKIKGQLAKDMLNIVGFQVPDKILKHICPADMLSNYGITLEEMQNMCMNKSLHHWYLSPEEKAKHAHFSWKSQHEDKDILDDLTPDDVRNLVESEDELCRCGSFIRIFPTDTTSKYLPYFEHSRYYNILFDAWEQKYHKNRSEGISVLQNLCQKNVHLQTIFKEPSFVLKL